MASLGYAKLPGKGTNASHLSSVFGDLRSAEGLTPVHVAAAWGCHGALELLLSRGGDPTLRDQVSTPRRHTWVAGGWVKDAPC